MRMTVISTDNTAMWLGAGNGVDPVWIQFEFDRAYKLHGDVGLELQHHV